MNQKPKKKLCWNCEGSSSVQDENCPYCGVYLSPLSIGDNSGDQHNPFAPPYRMNHTDEEHGIPKSPFATQEKDPLISNEEKVAEARVEEDSDETQTPILPTVLLLIGGGLLLFTLALVLFSQNGKLTLQWDADYWPLFLLLSGAMLFFGWKKLQNLQDSSEITQSVPLPAQSDHNQPLP